MCNASKSSNSFNFISSLIPDGCISIVPDMFGDDVECVGVGDDKSDQY